MSRILQLGVTEVDEATLADLCRHYQVRELSLFGSAARGEMRPDSDIDMLVEFLPEASIDLVDYASLMIDLTDLLGRKVDLVSKKGLKPLIRSFVLAEARVLYVARIALEVAAGHLPTEWSERCPSRLREAVERFPASRPLLR